jgi:hypothetical protein
MDMLGCRLIVLDESTRTDQIKKLIVFVEMDRSSVDARVPLPMPSWGAGH